VQNLHEIIMTKGYDSAVLCTSKLMAPCPRSGLQGTTLRLGRVDFTYSARPLPLARCELHLG
jgi:hypothetical protein